MAATESASDDSRTITISGAQRVPKPTLTTRPSTPERAWRTAVHPICYEKTPRNRGNSHFSGAREKPPLGSPGEDERASRVQRAHNNEVTIFCAHLVHTNEASVDV